MQYRKLGNLKKEVSILGAGAMRFPTEGKGDNEKVIKSKGIEILSAAFDRGINYVDTAYPYHNGESEKIVGEVLKNGYRDSVYVATKLPWWEVNTADDFDRLLDEQMTRLQVKQIDVYLIHYLHSGCWPKLKELKVMEWMEKKKAEGKIGSFGFSYHDNIDFFKSVVDEYDWEICQIQYNYMNEDFQAGTEGLHYAADKGLGIVVMEPLLGGSLAKFPEPIEKMWNDAPVGCSPVDAALRWVWNHKEVSILLSGMGSIEQVEQNCASADRAGVDTMSQEELELIRNVKDKYQELHPISCTSCKYCIPCPQEINIPLNIELFNNMSVHKGQNEAIVSTNRVFYNNQQEDKKASACTGCGICETKCPQSIPISQWMPKIAADLSWPEKDSE